MDWRMKDAQDHLGDVIDRALREGPQTIVREADAVVVVEAQEYERLKARRSMSFKEHLMSGPSLEGLDLSRDPGAGRDIDFG